MNTIAFRILLMLLLAVTGCLVTCGEKVAGAGSETTNGITGFVRHENGAVAAAAIVKLLPVDFNTTGNDTVPADWVDTTDNSGMYRFDDISDGTYNVIMRDEAVSSGDFIAGVAYTRNDTLLSVEGAVLDSLGTIRIILDSTYQGGVNTVYIPGTDIQVSTGDSLVYLTHVPEGTLPPLFVSSDTHDTVQLRDSITVKSNDTVTVAAGFNTRTTVLLVNTTQSGALLKKPLYNFPVLLRLDGSDKVFDDVAQNGSDLCITKPDTTPVAFEVSRWDTGAKEADIWILIDTLYPDTIREISMSWGGDCGVPGGVFDTAYGFEGVWHFESEEGDTVHDASVNNYHGVLVDQPSVSSESGIIGDGYRFDGTGGHILMPGTADSRLSFQEDGSYTVSAWVYIDQADEESRVVVSKGNYQYFLFYTSIHSGSQWEFSEYQSGKGWDLSAAPVMEGSWHLLTGVRDGTSQRLYFDGEIVDSTGFVYEITATSDHSYDLVVGRFLQDFGGNDYCYFAGIIDDVRISSVVRSSEWISMCYKNQNQKNALLYPKQP